MLDCIPGPVNNQPMIPNILQRVRTSLFADRAASTGTWKPPGHYYSPIPSWNEILLDQDQIWGASPSELPGIDLNVSQQLATLDSMAKFAHDVPYRGTSSPTLRYRESNKMFRRGSAAMLYLMLRVLRPSRIIEVGSGFSSAVMLDTNDLALDGSMHCTFIDPYADRLKSLLRTTDSEHEVIEKRLQDVPRRTFDVLEAGDILFVDSSHVSKTGSDVNVLLFEILPALKKGVFVHFHDIYYPFEYPRQWVEEGRAWNEAYALRAFLQYSDAFRIHFWASYLYQHRNDALQKVPEICANGSSIWLIKCLHPAGTGSALEAVAPESPSLTDGPLFSVHREGDSAAV